MEQCRDSNGHPEGYLDIVYIDRLGSKTRRSMNQEARVRLS